MQKKIWLFQLPTVIFFTFCFWITDLGVQGQLENALLREKIFPALSRLGCLMTDFKFSLRGSRTPKNKIVVIEIDGPSIERVGRWPWHRDVTAYLIEKIFQAGAQVVGLDMVFSEPDPRIPSELVELLKAKNLGGISNSFETDPQLAKVIHKYSDKLVLGWTTEMACQPLYEEAQYCPVKDPEATKLFPSFFDQFSFSEFHSPLPFDPAKTSILSFVTPLTNIPSFSQPAQPAGYFNAVLDSDGHIRRTSLLAIANGKPYPSLALEMARVGLKQKLQLTLDEHQRVKNLGFLESGQNIPVTPLGGLQINFRGPSQIFKHISADDLLSAKDTIEDPMNPQFFGKSKVEVFEQVLKDAYVLIGISAVGVFDMREFPFESNAPGVYGHANILDNVLSQDPLVPGGQGLSAMWVLLIMTLGVMGFAWIIERIEAVPALALCLCTVLVVIFFDVKLLFGKNYNINTAFLYLEIGFVFMFTLAAKYVMEERNKKFIRGAFSKYVAPSVVDSILKDPTQLSLGGEKRDLTILFSDIRGFTTFSEQMDAKALASFLNDYLGTMTALVFSNQGTLDKYIGDAVMAFWGAPLEQPDHAYHACETAIKMMKALAQENERFKTQYGMDVKIGIGINSGVVNVGNMGSENNFEYTVIGDHVNLASRVEGLTKKYGVTILTTRYTLDSVAQSHPGQILPHRVLDFVKVKGKKNTVELIQILEVDYSLEGLQAFAKGRELYSQQKWDEALLKFEEANILLNSRDIPSQVFSERCEFFKKNPPESDWDGGWEMENK